MGRALREKNRGGLEWNASLTCLGLLCRLIVLTQSSVWVFVFFADSHVICFRNQSVQKQIPGKNRTQYNILVSGRKKLTQD